MLIVVNRLGSHGSFLCLYVGAMFPRRFLLGCIVIGLKGPVALKARAVRHTCNTKKRKTTMWEGGSWLGLCGSRERSIGGSEEAEFPDEQSAPAGAKKQRPR